MSKIKFTTTIDPQLLQDIKIQAIKEKCSVSTLLELLIKEYLVKCGTNKSNGENSEG